MTVTRRGFFYLLDRRHLKVTSVCGPGEPRRRRRRLTGSPWTPSFSRGPGEPRRRKRRLTGSPWTPSFSRVLVAAGLALSAAGAPRPVGAADLEALRAEAQAIADEVTALEHRLAPLNRRAARLETAIAAASRDIGLAELDLHNTRAAATAAQQSYVARAIEAYKSSATSRLELLLSVRTLPQLLTVTKVIGDASEVDAEALAEYLAARDEALERQGAIDERKQSLLAMQASVEAVREAMQGDLAARRARVRELAARIERLEELARIAAEQAAQPSEALVDLLSPAGPAPEIPPDFAATGVTFEGIASWYGPGFEGKTTASGDIFDPSLYTAASKELPLGTWLFVVHEGKGVVVLVNDRGPYIEGRILDLSRAAAEAIGITGLGWIKAEILIEK